MKSYQATWEDAETSRHVELVVNYQLDATRVDINHVTPTRVTFMCPKSGKPQRSIGVWTDTGRRLLANQVAKAGRLATMAQEIAEGRLVEIRHAAQLPKSYTANPVLQA
jgi:hypothetical protein